MTTASSQWRRQALDRGPGREALDAVTADHGDAAPALGQPTAVEPQRSRSLVDAEKTRFDFSHDKPLQGEQLRRIEELVNLQIIRNQPVTAINMRLGTLPAPEQVVPQVIEVPSAHSQLGV